MAAATGLAPSAEETGPLVEEAQVTAKRLAALKRLRAEAVSLAVPGAVFSMDRQIRNQERTVASGRSSGSKVVNAVLRRHVANREAKARRQVAKNQSAARNVRKNARIRKATKRRQTEADKKAKAAKAAHKTKLDALPLTFSAHDCGVAGSAGLSARIRCLERLKLRSPKLSFELESRWFKVRDAYCAKYHKANQLKAACNIGALFVDDINKVLAQLVEHYDGATKFNATSQTGGDRDAFNRFFPLYGHQRTKACDHSNPVMLALCHTYVVFGASHLGHQGPT